ncbi:hypothetical protein ACH5RR_016897 [Cinchona calisaya]|uniref:DUF7356 domain-containing protein n=1 Tax=Cinchona calisaya TaxID=153742 RepID=A0ABD2ZYH6_9GENT
MNTCKTSTFLLLLYLIWAVPQRSTAAQDDTSSRPSPSPFPAVDKSDSADDKVGANPPKTAVVAKETCDLNFSKCHDDVMNVTACLLALAGDTPDGLFLLVHNDGESSVKLNVTVLPVDSTYDVAAISGHQVKKINVSSSNASRSLSIVLNAANWTCKIERKLGRDERHLNGVPYQELEMGQQGSGSLNNMETLEGRDQSWDDDWDEEKAVKSPGGNHIGNSHPNGVSYSLLILMSGIKSSLLILTNSGNRRKPREIDVKD